MPGRYLFSWPRFVPPMPDADFSLAFIIASPSLALYAIIPRCFFGVPVNPRNEKN